MQGLSKVYAYFGEVDDILNRLLNDVFASIFFYSIKSGLNQG